MASSDERRALAERLRTAAKTESGSSNYLWNRLEIAVNGWKFGDVIGESYVHDNGVLARLADLIEPPNDEPAFSLEVLRGVATMQLYMCGRCSAMIAGYSDATTFYAPRFCPNCGARVTSGGEG